MFLYHDLSEESYVVFDGNEHKTTIIYECVQIKNILWTKTSHWYTTFVSFFIPASVLVYCYIKILAKLTGNLNRLSTSKNSTKRFSEKRNKVTKTVIVFVSSFIILWLPVNVISLWYHLDQNFPRKREFFILKLVAHTMSYANSTVNPIIYGTERSVCLKRTERNRNLPRSDYSNSLL